MPLESINIDRWLKERENYGPDFSETLFLGEDLVATIFVGPNESKEFHENETDEWFYQHRGSMSLKVLDGEDFEIAEKALFLLPRNLPHLHVRSADSVGIVVQRLRPESTTSVPINIPGWIRKTGDLSRPPLLVNEPIFGASTDFTVMYIGGPSERGDFHVNPTEEWFFQLQGSTCLWVMGDKGFRRIQLEKGDMFLIPRNAPHNPTRHDNTAIGLVIECSRPNANDCFQWCCYQCSSLQKSKISHEVSFPVPSHDHLRSQLRDAIDTWNGDEKLRTCEGCGQVAEQDPFDMCKALGEDH